MKTKNIILYGAPGVGKTYNHKKLIALIESGKYLQNEIFHAIQKNEDLGDLNLFEEIETEGRFKFVTFHQSYSYEDFIEGYRPDNEGKIVLEDGVFKILADRARDNIKVSVIENVKPPFLELLNELLKDIASEKKVKIDLKREGSFINIYDYNERTIFFEKQNGDQSHSLSIKTLSKMYDEGKNTIINGGLAPYYNPLLEKLLEISTKTDVKKEEQKNYYLIIDEINRGNISKIFGELITLIEDDKRDSLSVELPYSREKFVVPSNLYIIATMNTTDKSIALLDVALRRRFTFLKMSPLDSVVPEIVRTLFQDLNKKILEHKGEDYLIGHGYFVDIKNDEDLEFVKKYKILPLLEEYFYGDEENLEDLKKLLELEKEN